MLKNLNAPWPHWISLQLELVSSKWWVSTNFVPWVLPAVVAATDPSYVRGGQTVAHCMRLFELSKKLCICFFIFNFCCKVYKYCKAVMVASVPCSIMFASRSKKNWCHRSIDWKYNRVFRFVCWNSNHEKLLGYQLHSPDLHIPIKTYPELSYNSGFPYFCVFLLTPMVWTMYLSLFEWLHYSTSSFLHETQ